MGSNRIAAGGTVDANEPASAEKPDAGIPIKSAIAGSNSALCQAISIA